MRDWIRDYRRQHRFLSKKRSGWNSYFYSFINAGESWFLIMLIGIAIGLVSAWINISAAWLTDIKQGICTTEWYLSKDVCCKGSIKSGKFQIFSYI